LAKLSLFIGLILLLNLAAGSEYAFGTKVLSTDADIGSPLCDMPESTAIDYWDTGARGYDEDDSVYLHAAPFGRNTVCANDVRLTPFGAYPAGSKVTSEDKDIGMPLTALPATINYLNLNGGRAYDLEDPMYVHQIDCGYGGMEAFSDTEMGFKERLPNHGDLFPIFVANCITFSDGYELLVPDHLADSVPEVVGSLRGQNIELVQGSEYDYYHILDTWLVKIAKTGIESNGSSLIDAIYQNQFIHTNDVRLSPAAGLTAGTKVMDFDIDQNKLVSLPPLLSFPAQPRREAGIRYFDANGNGVYDYPDDVYMDLSGRAPTDSVLVNDVRLSGPVP
jgi:hypothetical protein